MDESRSSYRVGMDRGRMATSKRQEVGLGMPGTSWTPRRIAFHVSNTQSSTPSMKPLNEPVVGNGSGARVGAGSGSHPAINLTKQNGQSSLRLPSNIPLQWPTPQKIGAGLSNLGNTCFLNSVLQCLTYTPPLAGYLQSGHHKMSCRVAGFCAFCALQEHVSQALTSSGRVVAPNKLAKNLRSICRSFRMWRQEDAHEYMRHLLEALHKCCIPPELASGSNSNSKPSQDKSLVYKIFGGRLRSQVKCSVCSHCSNTYDPFLDLSLDIVRADSVTKALTRFTAVDALDGDNQYRCAHCKKKVRAQKQFTIETVPNILTIQFKRFSSTVGSKIDKKVEFGTTLDMKPFCSSQESSLKFRLYGVLVHSGWSTHSGHYYCFVRTSSDIWHVLDDSRVTQVSEKTVLDQKAYMLFYVREVKKESIPLGKIVTKSVPSPAPALISAPKAMKSVFGTANGVSALPKSSIMLEIPNSPSECSTAVAAIQVSSTLPELVVDPAPSAAKGSSDGGEAPCPDPVAVNSCGESKEGGEKSAQLETCCNTVGCEGEPDWDEHYKNIMNTPMASPQNMLKLLRVIPRTRRYFMARALQRPHKGWPAQSGQDTISDSLTSTAKKEAKRPLCSNGEVSASKRQHKEASEGEPHVSLMISNGHSEKVDHVKSLDHREQNNVEPPCSVQEKDVAVEASADCLIANGLSNGSRDRIDEDKGSVRVVVKNGVGNNLYASNVNHVGEPVDRTEDHYSGAELRSDDSDESGCQRVELENGGFREHSVGNGSNGVHATNGTNGSTNLVHKDNLYGVGVPRWNEDEIGEKEVDRLLRETEKAPKLKQQDIWDAEYDRGRSKKVRNKYVEDPHNAEGRCSGSLKPENPFQAFRNIKVVNGVGNEKRVGNGIENGLASGNGTKGGQYLGSVGCQSAIRRAN